VREAKLFLRLDLASNVRLGPGKIRLLEEIARLGSISAAGRAMEKDAERICRRRSTALVAQLRASEPPPRGNAGRRS